MQGIVYEIFFVIAPNMLFLTWFFRSPGIAERLLSCHETKNNIKYGNLRYLT